MTSNLDDAGPFLDKCQALLVEKRDGRTIIDTPEFFQVIDPGMPITVCNAVYRTVFEEDSADEMIAAAMSRFKEHSLPFRWVVNSSSRPTDLAARLEARKPSKVQRSLGFAASCDQVRSLPAPHVTVEPLSAANLGGYILVVTEAFAEIGAAIVASLTSLAREAAARPKLDSLWFLARYKGEPAGIGTVMILRDGGLAAGYLAGGGVRPRFRHRGVVRMTGRFAQELLERGVPLVLTHAIETTSAPILRKLGFREFSPSLGFYFPAGR